MLGTATLSSNLHYLEKSFMAKTKRKYYVKYTWWDGCEWRHEDHSTILEASNVDEVKEIMDKRVGFPDSITVDCITDITDKEESQYEIY